MTDIIKMNLNVTHILYNESDFSLFALADKDKDKHIEVVYCLLSTYPPIIDEVLSQEYSNRQAHKLYRNTYLLLKDKEFGLLLIYFSI